ncbi:MAG: hypothetical protein RSB44_13935, partial [Carnobacterium sp.]
ARAGLLHDLFYYDWRTTKFDEGTHAYMHPRIAVKNAEKITELSALKEIKNYHYEIEVDGGIVPETAAKCKLAGADVFVAGSYVYNAENPLEQIQNLKDALK